MSPVRKFPTIVLAACMATAAAQTFYGNGYTIIEGMEAETGGDLQAYVFKTIDAATVEDGLRQLLNGSGWALAQPINADPNIWRLYRQPWPDNKRTINPMPLGEALAWIAGDGWALVVDPVNRLVSFEVAPRYARIRAADGCADCRVKRNPRRNHALGRGLSGQLRRGVCRCIHAVRLSGQRTVLFFS